MATRAGELVSGALTANGRGLVFQPQANNDFNAWIYGTFSATVTIQRSFDDGTTWLTVSKPDLSDAAFTTPVNMVVDEPRAGVLYSILVSSYISGTVSYRFDQ